MATKKQPQTESSIAVRVARHAQRRRDLGLVHFRMWVPPEVVEDLRKYADKLASEVVRRRLEGTTS